MSFSHADAGTPEAQWQRQLELLDLPTARLDVRRLVVLAAHPDDECLGAGGLVARAHREGVEVTVLAATDGEASHPASTTHLPARLAGVRRCELRQAVGAVAPGSALHALGLPDGDLAAHEDHLLARLVELVGDGRDCLLVAPWRHDGHGDHEAAGRAAAVAAARTDARLWEYPVWFWHWADPAASALSSASRVELTLPDRLRKCAAVAAHRSQVEPLSALPGDEALLGADFLAYFARPFEVFWEQPVGDDALEQLHGSEAEPWGADERWFEQRKRSLLLAALPRRRFRLGVELGCSTGMLSAELATRCDRLRAVDSSRTAVAAARARLGPHEGVEVREGVLPRDWPLAAEEGADLVVLSEVGYFLSHGALEELGRRVVGSLAPDGVVVLCHWRHEVVGWPLDGPAVHAALRASGLPPVVASYQDRDVEILVLSSPDQLPDHRA